jgi:F-type H+-transporting ATPase subunit b
MKINWFTVIAQVINFLILVWLLRKFLYKPVLDAIDAREKKIVARLQDAKHQQELAQSKESDFTEKNKQFDAQKKELMDKAIADTNQQKEKLMEEVRVSVGELKSKQQKSLENMQETLKRELAQEIQQQVLDISRKVLTDLSSVDLEEQTAKHFISRLDELTTEEKKQFVDAFKAGTKPVLIQSAFEMQKQQQTAIKNAVDHILGKETEFEFTTVPAVISGIELSANGYKLSWSISAYLDSLQNTISATIKDKVPETKKAPDQKPIAKENASETVAEPEKK